MKQDRQRFTFFRSYYEAIKDLKKSQRNEIYEAIVKYSFEDDYVPNFKGILYTVWVLIEPTLKKCNQQYENSKKPNESQIEANDEPTDSRPILENREKNIDIDLENIKENKQKKRFVKPNLEEVLAYCKERNNKVDPQKFIDYYESNGWKVGRNSMKDWKAAIRTWERNDGNFANKKMDKPKENIPDWFDKKQESSTMTAEEQKQMDELLEDFK